MTRKVTLRKYNLSPKAIFKAVATPPVLFCGFIGLMASGMTLPLWLPPVVSALNADGVERVRTFAREESLAAGKVCRFNFQAAGVYDSIIAQMTADDLFLNDGDKPYRPGEWADLLQAMRADNIVIRDIDRKGDTNNVAGFFRADTPDAPDVLVLKSIGTYSMLREFIAEALARRATMAPGSALVLNAESSYLDRPHYIVEVPPGADTYVRPANNGNPYGRAVNVPRPDC